MAVFTVTTLSDVTAADGQTTLREALVLANASAGADEIVFAGTLAGQISLTGGTLQITDDVTISGDVDGNGTSDITLNGLGANRVANIASGTAELSDLRIVGGYSGTGGAGIAVGAGATLNLDSSTVAANTSYGGSGGAIFSDGGTIRISDSNISQNTASYGSGGAVAITGGGTLEVTGSTFGGNSAGYNGGAIDVNNASVVIDRTLIVNNQATGEYGGGLHVVSGTADVYSSTLSANRGDYGGGIAARIDSDVTLINTTVARNDAVSGGGVYLGGGTVDAISTTIAGNFATGIGGGVYTGAGLFGVTNSIVFGNNAGSLPNLYGPVQVTGGAIMNGSVFQNGTRIGTTTAPEVFEQVVAGRAVLAANGGPLVTVAIREGGPAEELATASLLPQDTRDLDGDGNTTEALPVDARGDLRVANQLPDVGAFEVVRILLTGTAGNDVLQGQIQAETIFGRSGNDTLLGDGGDDTLLGGGGADRLDGGDGDDTASYADASTALLADLVDGGFNTGFAVGDTFVSIENLLGSAQDDDLRGDQAANGLSGGDGKDRLVGRGGDDTLDAGTGNDILIGNSGQDHLSGGAGSDRFVYFDATDSERGVPFRDIISDFDSNLDRIDLRGIDADPSTVGDDAFVFLGSSAFTGAGGELRIGRSAPQNLTLVRVDRDGDGVDDFQIELTGLIDLDASNFLL